jgi:hypothetical protein
MGIVIVSNVFMLFLNKSTTTTTTNYEIMYEVVVVAVEMPSMNSQLHQLISLWMNISRIVLIRSHTADLVYSSFTS